MKSLTSTHPIAFKLRLKELFLIISQRLPFEEGDADFAFIKRTKILSHNKAGFASAHQKRFYRAFKIDFTMYVANSAITFNRTNPILRTDELEKFVPWQGKYYMTARFPILEIRIHYHWHFCLRTNYARRYANRRLPPKNDEIILITKTWHEHIREMQKLVWIRTRHWMMFLIQISYIYRHCAVWYVGRLKIRLRCSPSNTIGGVPLGVRSAQMCVSIN